MGWALIRGWALIDFFVPLGWALIRIKTVRKLKKPTQFNSICLQFDDWML